MSARRVVLGSSSPYRRELMERLGIPFDVCAPDVDETPVHETENDPVRLVEELALAKSRAVAEMVGEGVIIGSDQTAEVDGTILHKPGDFEGNLAQLQALRGRTHRLLTAVVVLDAESGLHAAHLDVHHLRMRKLSDDQLRAYVRRDEPFDCAGGYRIERAGIALFDEIRGVDHTAIVGLPMMAVARMLAGFGVDVFADE